LVILRRPTDKLFCRDSIPASGMGTPAVAHSARRTRAAKGKPHGRLSQNPMELWPRLAAIERWRPEVFDSHTEFDKLTFEQELRRIARSTPRAQRHWKSHRDEP